MKILINYIRFAIYLIVFSGYSQVFSGSYDDFFAAVKKDDDKVVGALLQRGFDVNTPDVKGETALLTAAREPSLKVMAVLLAWPGLTPEVRSAQDESPLMLAALKGLTGVCERLIELGADVNKPGWAPLHYAATRGHLGIMQLLLDQHAYIDAQSPNNTTPLMMAAHYGTPSAVKLLLEAGADPLLKNDLGLSAIDFAHRASRKESADIISAFVRGRQATGSW